MGTVTGIYVLTPQGAELADKIAAKLDADIYIPPFLERTAPPSSRKYKTYDSLSGLIGKTFSAYRNHVFIAAAGVAVRCIAPHVGSQSIDPAVVAMDRKGKYVVSLLSGQLDGANDLARTVADIVGGTPVITTARDTENVPSFDILALELGLRIGNITAVPAINEALGAGERVEVDDRHNHLRLKHSAWKELFDFSVKKKSSIEFAAEVKKPDLPAPRITVTASVGPARSNHLILHPPVLHVGIDGRRGVRADDILELITTSLEQMELAQDAIGAFAVAESRRYEQGILQAAEQLEVPVNVFSAKDIDAVPMPKLKNPPDFGLAAEPLARLSAGENASVRIARAEGRGIAITVAESIPGKE